jgi:hypothetical protein
MKKWLKRLGKERSTRKQFTDSPSPAAGSTTDPAEAAEIAFQEILPKTHKPSPDVIQAMIKSFREVPNDLGAKYLYKGTLDSIQSLVLYNLKRISQEAGFRRFEVSLHPNGDSARVAAFFSGFWVPVHVIQSESESDCLAIGNADFKHSEDLVADGQIEVIGTDYETVVEKLHNLEVDLRCRHCGTGWTVETAQDLIRLAVHFNEEEGFIIFMCPKCHIQDFVAITENKG